MGIQNERKLIRGDEFIKALKDTGLLPSGALVTAVTICAELGELITLDWTELGDSRLLEFAAAQVETEDPAEAVAR